LCQAKHIKSFEHFAARDAMNMEGLSEATLEKFIQKGMIKKFTDLYHLEQYKDLIVNMEGFGQKSYDNLIMSVETSRKTTLAKLIYGLGIGNVGLTNAKMICKQLGNDIDKIINISREEIQQIDGIGDVIADTFVTYFENEDNKSLFNDLLKELDIAKEENSQESNILEGKIFVITGSVEHFENRNELKDFIESLGGKTTGSVTSKTDYLINNDSMSGSSKNKSAAKLGVPVITEEEFLKLAEREDLL